MNHFPNLAFLEMYSPGSVQSKWRNELPEYCLWIPLGLTVLHPTDCIGELGFWNLVAVYVKYRISKTQIRTCSRLRPKERNKMAQQLIPIVAIYRRQIKIKCWLQLSCPNCAYAFVSRRNRTEPIAIGSHETEERIESKLAGEAFHKRTETGMCRPAN